MRSKTFDINFQAPYLELWGNLLQIKVGNRSEEIGIKLFKESKDENPDVCLATGSIILLDTTKQSWKTFPKEVLMVLTNEGKSLLKIPPSLQLDLQYRYSKFIKTP